MRKRYVVECVWSGYQSSQARPCHRRVITRPELYEGLHTVQFTDGTTMSVTVRPAMPREKVEEIRGYDDLLGKITSQKLAGKGFVTVRELCPPAP